VDSLTSRTESLVASAIQWQRGSCRRSTVCFHDRTAYLFPVSARVDNKAENSFVATLAGDLDGVVNFNRRISAAILAGKEVVLELRSSAERSIRYFSRQMDRHCL
jgi:hypothetical protein